MKVTHDPEMDVLRILFCDAPIEETQTRRGKSNSRPFKKLGSSLSGREACLEGEIAFQIEGQPEKILKAGDALFEPANTRILRFDNVGPGKAKFVASYLLGKDDHELIKMIP
jgi:hypothetical protein